MRVCVKLFAAAREAARQETIPVELPEAATIGTLRQAIQQQYPQVDRIARHSLFAVDNEYADNSTVLSPSQEIACIPPVSGG